MGNAGTMPWHLPEDLKHFRKLTIDKPVVMGRKTYASLGKPLVRRRNIVLTRDPDFHADGIEVAHSVEEALALTRDDPEVAVIGGAQIFTAFAPRVNTAFVTRIEADLDGDTYYSAPDRAHSSEVIGTFAADDRNPYDLTFLRLDYATP